MLKFICSQITIIFSKFIYIFCPTSKINFKYLVIWCLNSHLLISTYKSMVCNFDKTFYTWFQCSDKKLFVYINILFKYVETNSFKYFHKILLIYYWKLFNAFFKSKKLLIIQTIHILYEKSLIIHRFQLYKIYEKQWLCPILWIVLFLKCCSMFHQSTTMNNNFCVWIYSVHDNSHKIAVYFIRLSNK